MVIYINMLLTGIVHHGDGMFEAIDYEQMKDKPQSKKDKEFEEVDVTKYKKKKKFRAFDFDRIRENAPVSEQ